MQNDLQKVLNLAKKTGDRIIVFDYNKPENTYVVMGLEEYEKIAVNKERIKDLTEGELLDKINRDIALWKSDDSLSVFENETTLNNGQVKTDSKDETHLRQGFGGQGKKKNNWNIPKDVKEAAEEVMEEDRHYLEEVSF